MLTFLNELLQEEKMWYFTETVDVSMKCQDEKLSEYILKLQKIIQKQRIIFQKLISKIKDYQNQIFTKCASTQTDVELERNDIQPKKKSISTSSWQTEHQSIQDMVKEVAEDALKQTGFVYEATSGLYYDYNSGYYYNAELGLYYDGHSGTYFYYDKDQNVFQFHSQVSIPENTTNQATVTTTPAASKIVPKSLSKKRRDKNRTSEKTVKKLKKKEDCDVEEGECSEDSNEPTEISSDEDSEDDAAERANENLNLNVNPEENSEKCIFRGNEDEISKAWPPCMRIMVQETSVKNLQVGTLFIVTCGGGTIGRQGDHAILIPDINISKFHARFSFDNKDKKNEIGNYTLTDLGSRNGTFIDGKRLSNALQESEPFPLSHDCSIRVGGTTLLCHIHSGLETCAQCEPGLIISDKDEKRNAYVSEESISEKRKKQIRKIKLKFGLNSGTDSAQGGSVDYKDRAEIRRQTVGSHSDSFKTDTASVTEPIKNTNKGFKMLSKMGWTEGESLGAQSEDAIKEPILVQQRSEKVGLGYDKPVEAELDESVKKKQEIWRKVADRYKNLE